MPALRSFTYAAKGLELASADLYSTLAYVKSVPTFAPATQELRGIRKEATALIWDRMFGRTRRITACMAAVGVAGALAVASANATIVYNSASSPLPGNLPSQAFEATQTAEFGGEVGLAGSDRLAQWVQVVMSSWGCENGTWNGGNCSTTPGTTFNEPITLNLYQVGAGGAPGAKIASITQTFAIPFRPSADATHCTGTDAGKWYDSADGACYNGFAVPITFDVSSRNITLPDDVIATVAYNTSDYGTAPYGRSTACAGSPQGCGYDSLNVALTNGSSSSAVAPTVGTNPDPNDAYVLGQGNGAYCDGGLGGIDALRLDTPAAGHQPCWTGLQPEVEIDATVPSTVIPAGVNGNTPSALTLTQLSTQPVLGTFTPGVSADYTGSMVIGATDTGTASQLTAYDPSATDTGHLVNGNLELAQPLKAGATDAANPTLTFAPVGSLASPLVLLNEAAPLANDAIAVTFKQSIGATDPLGTGSYSKTILLTLTTTTP